MNKKLLKLAEILDSEGLTNESAETYRLASYGQATSELDKWQEAWASVSQPIPQQFPGRAIKLIMEGLSGLSISGEEISGADPKAIQYAGEAIKSLSSSMEFDHKTLTKLSKIGKDPEITKEAGASLSDVPGWTRAIPFVGPLISGMLSIKNIYYGLEELGRVLDSSKSLGVPWYASLESENLNTLADRHSNDPEKIIIVDQLAKSVQVLWDETISFITNYVDFIKDCVFAIADFYTLGWSLWLDVGLSFVFMGIEIAVESYALKSFKEVVQKIKIGVSSKFKEILLSVELDPNRERRRFTQQDFKELEAPG